MGVILNSTFGSSIVNHHLLIDPEQFGRLLDEQQFLPQEGMVGVGQFRIRRPQPILKLVYAFAHCLDFIVELLGVGEDEPGGHVNGESLG